MYKECDIVSRISKYHILLLMKITLDFIEIQHETVIEFR